MENGKPIASQLVILSIFSAIAANVIWILEKVFGWFRVIWSPSMIIIVTGILLLAAIALSGYALLKSREQTTSRHPQPKRTLAVVVLIISYGAILTLVGFWIGSRSQPEPLTLDLPFRIEQTYDFEGKKNEKPWEAHPESKNHKLRVSSEEALSGTQSLRLGS